MSLEPARHSWRIWRGATFHKKVTILVAGVGSDPRDLTDYTALLEIKDKPEPEGEVLLTLTTDDGSIILGDDLGTVELIISATDTAAILWQHGVYDLIITAPGAEGETDALLHGNFTVAGV